MKLNAQLNDLEHQLTIERSDNRTVVQVDGRKYELEIRELENDRYLIFEGTQVYECSVSVSRNAQEEFEVGLRGNIYPVTIFDPKRLRSAQTSDRHHHGAAEIVSPMPGKVVRVLVTVGAEVQKGAGLIVVEAMKMQNEMKSPQTGVVVSIKVSPGDTVNAGDVLAVVE
jgi:biotin carboxyl carrier protein